MSLKVYSRFRRQRKLCLRSHTLRQILELQYGCIGLQVAFETGIISQPTSSPRRHATKINDCTHANAMQKHRGIFVKIYSHSGPGANSLTRFDPPIIRVDPGRGRRRVPCPGRYLMDTLVIETRQSDRSYFIGSQSLLVSFHRWLSGAVSWSSCFEERSRLTARILAQSTLFSHTLLQEAMHSRMESWLGCLRRSCLSVETDPFPMSSAGQ